MLGDAGQAAAAEAQFQAALELDANYAPALAGLGTLYAREGKHAEAARELERALAVIPRQDEARFNLAQVYEQMGRVADARAEYQRLVDTPGTNPAVRAAAGRRLAALRR
jgi:protein O-GlcNAc transferase